MLLAKLFFKTFLPKWDQNCLVFSVLESVGKKTMKVINETDPGLNKTKSILAEQRGKINLSQILRDAKKEREENEQREEKFIENQKTKFDYWFEEKQVRFVLELLL